MTDPEDWGSIKTAAKKFDEYESIRNKVLDEVIDAIRHRNDAQYICNVIKGMKR